MRARMVTVAATLGWLTPDEERDEQVRIASDLIARDAIGYAEVDLVCSMNSDGRLDAAAARSPLASLPDTRVGPAAVLACLGRRDAHQRVVRALVSSDERDVRIAQAYLRNRPVTDQLAQVFADANSINVQRAIAEVFLRSDARALPKAELAAIVRRHRLKGDDLIDQLLRKLQS
jgi:hypothetical protein